MSFEQLQTIVTIKDKRIELLRQQNAELLALLKKQSEQFAPKDELAAVTRQLAVRSILLFVKC
jgi:hypothetical protein